MGRVGSRGGLRGGMRRGCSWGREKEGERGGWLACEYGLEAAWCGGGCGGSKRHVAGKMGQLRADAWE